MKVRKHYENSSHVGMSGKEMLLGSSKRSRLIQRQYLYVLYSAPQNTRRKDISELNIDAAWDYMSAHGIDEIVVHAPYIINLGNTIKPETFELAVEFLQLELERTESCKSHTLILHPGAHVGAGADAGIAQIVKGLNTVLTKDTNCNIALETMAGRNRDRTVFTKYLHASTTVLSTTKSCASALIPAIHMTVAIDIIHDFDGVSTILTNS